jgi:hypothetical protein
MQEKDYEAHVYLLTGAILAPSAIPIILSSIASLLAIINYLITINKNRNK